MTTPSFRQQILTFEKQKPSDVWLYELIVEIVAEESAGNQLIN